MRIAMFTNTYAPHVGGVARSVEQLRKDLRGSGHAVLVFAPTFEGAETSTAKTVRIPAIQNFNGTDFSVRLPSFGLITEHLEAFQPDIIHSHHPFLLGDSAMRHARQNDIPLVFTHHTLYEQYTHYIGGDSDTLKKLAVELSVRYCNLCDHIVAPSSTIKNLLEDREVESPISAIPTGVDLDFWKKGNQSRFRKKHGVPEDAFVIGTVSRLAKEKNLDYLSEAALAYLRENEDAYCLFAGKGDRQEPIQKLFEKAGVQDRLIMPGNVDGDDLADAYAALDVFIFASQSETQGMVLAEAMASAKPVVALSASGVNDILEEGKNGYQLGADAPPEEFATAVQKIRDELAESDSLIKGALETAHTLSRQKIADRMIELYETLIDQAPTKKFKEIDYWDRFQNRIQTEWDIFSSRAEAAAKAIKNS